MTKTQMQINNDNLLKEIKSLFYSIPFEDDDKFLTFEIEYDDGKSSPFREWVTHYINRYIEHPSDDNLHYILESYKVIVDIMNYNMQKGKEIKKCKI